MTTIAVEAIMFITRYAVQKLFTLRMRLPLYECGRKRITQKTAQRSIVVKAI